MQAFFSSYVDSNVNISFFLFKISVLYVMSTLTRMKPTAYLVLWEGSLQGAEALYACF